MKVFGLPRGSQRGDRKQWIEVPSGVKHNPKASTPRGKRRAAKRGGN